MLSTYLLKSIQSFSEHVNENNCVVKSAEIFSKIYEQNEASFRLLLLEKTNNLSYERDQIVSRINKEANVAKNETPNMEFFLAVAEFEKEITSLWLSIGSMAELVDIEIIQSLKSFANAYSNYLDEQRIDNASKLIHKAYLFRSSLNVLIHTLDSVYESLHYDGGLDENEDKVTIILEGSFNLQDLNDKLEAILAMYRELARIYGLEGAERIPRVLKAETGSFFIELAGNELVIGALIYVMGKAVQIAYQRHTPEGQLEAMHTQLEFVKMLAQHNLEMSEYGIDIESDKAVVQEINSHLNHKVKTLLMGTDSAKINDNTYEIQNVQPKRIEGPIESPSKLTHTEAESPNGSGEAESNADEEHDEQ